MAKQKTPTKSKTVEVLHSVFNPASGTVVPAGTILNATEAKQIPKQYLKAL